MSSFIVPLSSLPTISSITDVQGKQGLNKQQATGEGVPFADLLQNAFQNLAQTNEVSQAGMYDLATNATDDMHTGAVQALKYSTAVSYASGLASSAISAYNELMRMSI